MIQTPVSESRVDRDSHFNGLYQTKQNLFIEGSAEGTIECEGTLTVVEGARVKAQIMASTVSIAGYLEGEVVCQDVFQIMPSGEVQATVSARRLVVNEGGIFNGVFHMIESGSDPAVAAAHRSDDGGEPKRKGASRRTQPDESTSPSSSNLLPDDDWWAKMTGGSTPHDGDAEAK
jgi:cytoskeletal protein CcmA (bactofilin family)